MQTASLGPFTVGRLPLGAVFIGGGTPRAEAYGMLDRFVEAGGNLVNTADTALDGVAEDTLGGWLASRRDEVVVATAVRFPVSDPGGEGLSANRVRRACDASLRRLGVDAMLAWAVAVQDREGWAPFVSFQPVLARRALDRARAAPDHPLGRARGCCSPPGSRAVPACAP